MTLTTARRHPELLAFEAGDNGQAVRMIVLDGRVATPTVSKEMANRVQAGGCIVVFTTPRLLEETAGVLDKAGFIQPRFLKTEDGAPRTPWGSGHDDTTYALMVRPKKGPYVFNERYHSGRLNGVPVDPSPKVEGPLKGAQGAVERVDIWPVGEAARLRHSLAEVASIHTLPEDMVAVDSALLEALGLGPSHNGFLRVLYRTRPPNPALSDEAQKRRDERDAKRAALRAGATTTTPLEGAPHTPGTAQTEDQA